MVDRRSALCKHCFLQSISPPFFNNRLLSILDQLQLKQTWIDFLSDRTDKNRLSDEEHLFFTSLIESGDYLDAARSVSSLSTVKKMLVNKGGTNKKRVVYTFTPTENASLKIIAFLCSRFDGRLPDNLYSFRSGCGVKSAIVRLTNTPNIDKMWAYKLDIHDYFNSINVEQLMFELKSVIFDDPELFAFFEMLLSGDCASYDGKIVHESRGVMAGTPTSTFLANVFLSPLDRHFIDRNVLYARYSDDIILFASTQEDLSEHRAYISDYLFGCGLTINTDKEGVYEPDSGWEYLGIAYKAGRIDLSHNTKEKLKGKIRRKARALYRWKLKKGAGNEQAMRAFLRAINRKLYIESEDNRFCWSRWFFPLINTDEGLHELDEYIVQYARFVGCGCFGSSSYRIRYSLIGKLGFRPLVAEYWDIKKAKASKV